MFSYPSLYSSILDKIRKRKVKCQAEIAEGENCAGQNDNIVASNHVSWKIFSSSLNMA